MNIYVGNLSQDVSEEDLSSLFSEYGKVSSAKVIRDMFAQTSKGFGFVEMEGHEARAAVAGLDGKDYNGKYLRVRFEDPRKKRGKGKRR